MNNTNKKARDREIPGFDANSLAQGMRDVYSRSCLVYMVNIINSLYSHVKSRCYTTPAGFAMPSRMISYSFCYYEGQHRELTSRHIGTVFGYRGTEYIPLGLPCMERAVEVYEF